ncbi:hypothetical protein DSAG12_01958 [Promethearchaeum syntrophicum]|uniref:Double-stranded DNA-binding domain protein n=1 Tax=Promethearchaeum syntrophicum TaxID=2594042 RepID=A0A5B9DA69_9ARCH
MSDDELHRIRMQKMQEILNKKKQAEQRSQRVELPIDNKMDQILAVLLAPNANQYLNIIKQRNYELFAKIRQKIFPPKIMPELDLLLQYLRQGMIRRGVISLIEIQQIERQILGIGSSITIKKQGQDAKTLSNFLKEDED